MPRPSAIYKTTRNNKRLGTRYKFPILDANEIIEVFDALDFGINEATLVKPTQTFMKGLIEQVLDKFLYISPHALRRKIDTTPIDDPYEEDSLRNSLNIVAPNRIVYKFLCDCGIKDFSMRDVAKPDPTRVRVILSAIINFARFREERMGDCDALLESSDGIMIKYKEALEVNDNLHNKVTTCNNEMASEGMTMDEVNQKNSELETSLKDLRDRQQKLSKEHSKYKTEKMGLIKELENESTLYINSEKELEQMQPYIKESPESVRELIKKMKESLDEERNRVNQLEEKSKKITTSINSFQLLTQQFEKMQTILGEIKQEADKEHESDERLQQVSTQLEQCNEMINDHVRRINQCKKQLEHNQERITKLKSFYETKLGPLNDKLAEKQAQLQDLHTQQDHQVEDAASKKAQIQRWHKQMVDLQRGFDTECKEANFEMEKLGSHIKLYEGEMSRKLKEQQDSLKIEKESQN